MNTVNTTEQVVLSGKCDQDCKNIYLFIFFIMMTIMTTFIGVTPKNMIVLRYHVNLYFYISFLLDSFYC